MRKSAFIIAVLLALASPCLAQEQVARMSAPMLGASVPAAAAASCQASTKEAYETTGTYESFSNGASTVYQAWPITPGSTYPLCKAGASFLKIGSPTFTITFSIRANNSSPSDRPATTDLYTTTSTALNAADLTGSYAWYYQLFNNETLTSGTKYWIVVKASAAGDALNHVRISASTTDGRNAYSADGATWSIATADTVDWRTYAYE